MWVQLRRMPESKVGKQCSAGDTSLTAETVRTL